MTTLAQTLNHLLIDREGAEITISNENAARREQSQRTTQPFSELRNGKFRRLFDRHYITRR